MNRSLKSSPPSDLKDQKPDTAASPVQPLQSSPPPPVKPRTFFRGKKLENKPAPVFNSSVQRQQKGTNDEPGCSQHDTNEVISEGENLSWDTSRSTSSSRSWETSPSQQSIWSTSPDVGLELEAQSVSSWDTDCDISMVQGATPRLETNRITHFLDALDSDESNRLSHFF